jgi:hypothetical protein
VTRWPDSEPPRVIVPGRWHLLTVRGRLLFPTEDSKPDFVSKALLLARHLDISILRCRLWQARAEMIMRPSSGGFAQFFRRFGTSWGMYVNRKISSGGPVFWGRYQSQLLEDAEAYARTPCDGAYIHENEEFELSAVAVQRSAI